MLRLFPSMRDLGCSFNHVRQTLRFLSKGMKLSIYLSSSPLLLLLVLFCTFYHGRSNARGLKNEPLIPICSEQFVWISTYIYVGEYPGLWKMSHLA